MFLCPNAVKVVYGANVSTYPYGPTSPTTFFRVRMFVSKCFCIQMFCIQMFSKWCMEQTYLYWPTGSNVCIKCFCIQMSIISTFGFIEPLVRGSDIWIIGPVLITVDVLLHLLLKPISECVYANNFFPHPSRFTYPTRGFGHKRVFHWPYIVKYCKLQGGYIWMNFK
jgi:hypothetical protein